MLKAEKVTVKIGKATLLTDVSINVRPGEFVALVGPNGAGKSTLLKAISGSMEPTSGSVAIDGIDIKGQDCNALARRRAVLSQNTTLDFPFTAKQVAMLGRNPHLNRRETAADDKIVDDALRAVEADHLADRKFVTLSGGEQQRVHLARVMSQIWEVQPDKDRYLFLDEPTNGLDIAHQHMSLDVAKQFAAEETGVVAVLHDLNLASQYADKIMILKEGKCFAYGEPKDVLTEENIEAAFGVTVLITRSPSVNGETIIVATGIANKKSRTVSA